MKLAQVLEASKEVHFFNLENAGTPFHAEVTIDKDRMTFFFFEDNFALLKMTFPDKQKGLRGKLDNFFSTANGIKKGSQHE